MSRVGEFYKYVSLSVLGILGVSCYILADTFFVSLGLGLNGLAALNLAIPAYNFMYGSALLLGMGGATKYAVYKSQGDGRNADRVFTNTALLAAGCSALLFACGAFGAGGLARLLGADAQTYEMTEIYLRVLLMFSPAFVFNTVLVCFVRNDGAPHTAMFATLSGSLANILLDYVFIFPLGMGMLGAVLATGIAPVIGILFSAGHILRGKNGFHLRVRDMAPRLMKYNVTLGLPAFVEQMSSAVVILTFNALFLRICGNTGVAAYGVIANLSLVVLAVFNGISQGSQPLLSRARGRQDERSMRALLGYSVVTALVFSAAAYLCLYVFAAPITRIFNSENSLQLQEMAERGLRLYFIATPFAGLNLLFCSYFTATETPMPAHLLSLARGLAVILPVALLLAWLFEETGIWLAFPVTECAVCVAAIAVYFVLARRQARRFGTGARDARPGGPAMRSRSRREFCREGADARTLAAEKSVR